MAVCWSAKLPAVTLLALTAALKQKWSGTRCGFWVGFWEGKGGGQKWMEEKYMKTMSIRNYLGIFIIKET